MASRQTGLRLLASRRLRLFAVNFVVARNPDPDSRLPYLIRLPIDGGLILEVRDTWPRTSRVFRARVGRKAGA